MYIMILSFLVLFFVGCDANMNSFNINIEGTVDYKQNMSNSNIKANSDTTNNTTTNNTNTNDTNNTSNTSNTNNTQQNIADALGAQLSTASALEVSSGTGIPVTGGDGDKVGIEIYKEDMIVQYIKTMTKIKYSLNIESITDLGLVNGSMGRVPVNTKFLKVYYDQDGDSISKIYEIQSIVNVSSSGTLPK